MACSYNMSMKYLILIFFVACSTPKSKLESDSECLKALASKKIVAPNGVESMGVYSNLVQEGDVFSGYKIRIVKRKDYCQALILEYNQSLEPQLYSISNLFECEESLSTVSMDTKLGFYSPFSDSAPEDFYFGFDGRVDSSDKLIGHISFPNNDLKGRPEKTKVSFEPGPKDQASMAAFDWEIIERLKLKRACFR